MLATKKKDSIFPCFSLYTKSTCIVILLSLFLFNRTAYAEETSPLDAVAVLQSGIEAKDMNIVEQAVDVDAVLRSALDVFLIELKERRAKRKNPVKETKAMEVIFAVADNPTSTKSLAVKALLLQEAKKFVTGVVQGGYLLGEQKSSLVKTLGIFSSLQSWFDDCTVKQVTAGKVLSEQEDEALLSASYVDNGTVKFPLELLAKKENTIWRIKEIHNLKELLSRAGNEQ